MTKMFQSYQCKKNCHMPVYFPSTLPFQNINEKQSKNTDVYCLSLAEGYSELPNFQPCSYRL